MPCKRRACSFWRRCSSCSDRSASIPRKSKWWLEDVEGAGLHGPIRTKRIILRLQTPVDGVEGATTATDAAHDAVAAVPGVDGESGDLCRPQKRPPVGRVAYWPACNHHCNRGEPQTSFQKGTIRANA